MKKYNIDELYGDTEVDYKAAKIANCDFYAAKNGFRSESFWNKKNVKFWEIESSNH